MKTLLTLLVTNLILIGCTAGRFDFAEVPSVGSPEGESGRGRGSEANLFGLVVIDSNAENLGSVLSGSIQVLTILNDLGYVYNIYWNGDLIQQQTFYTSGDCTGTPYMYAGASKFAGKMVHVDGDGNPLVPLNEASDGTAQTATKTAGSVKNSAGSCTTSGASGSFVELTTVSRSAIGIPASIVGPLTIEEN